MNRTISVSLAVAIFASLFFSFVGCGGGKKKTATKKDYGKPTWQKVDPDKFVKLSDYETTLEGGKVLVYDPEGWERMPRGAAKPPKGFKSVIVFQKGDATIMMTKSEKSKGMGDLDEENIEEFAEMAQQSFKTPVKMIKLGNVVGVLFGRRSQHAQRLNKQMDRRIIATAIDGELYTYELITDRGKMNDNLMNTLYGLVSKTKIEGMESSDDSEETMAIASTSESATPETKPAEPIEVAAKTETPEPVAEEKPMETKPAEPVAVVGETKPAEPVEVASAPKPEPKKETKKQDKKPAKKKGNTKDILSELDALLN